MALKWIVPSAFVALMSVGVPAQSAPIGVGAGNGFGHSAVQQAHYYRHHRGYRYYRAPGAYFYSGHRRHWRHHRHW